MGVDIGTTAVKALAVDENGEVVARSRVAHRILASEADQLRHDARRAWRAGPAKAYAELSSELVAAGNGEIAGVAVTSMVPSLTAVNRRGVPTLPGLLYGDFEGRPPAEPVTAGDDVALAGMPDAEGFMRWAHALAPDARGYWPCQAVATYALSGVPAIDTGVTASMGDLHAGGKWNSEILDAIGVAPSQLPVVVPMATAGGTLPGTETVFTGGSIDAMCDQVVGGADGARRRARHLRRHPDRLGGHRRMAAGARPHQLSAHDAGAVPDRWAEQRRRILRGLGPDLATRRPPPGPARETLGPRLGSPDRVPVWLPYVRG